MTKFVLAALVAAGWAAMAQAQSSAPSTVKIGAESLLEHNPRSDWARVVNNAPVSGETVNLNPPRFRWWYHPKGLGGGLYEFTFQIASEPTFAKPVVNITTPYNFYNTLAPLSGAGPWYWRVGYMEQNTAPASQPATRPFEMQWSQTRSFRIAEGAQVWDRSALAKPTFAAHPRIILTDARKAQILRLMETDADVKALVQSIRDDADAAIASAWYGNFPADDTQKVETSFYSIADRLAHVAFMHRLTGEKKYAGVIDRALTFAGYPKGGKGGPQPYGDASEDSTQTTEFLALMYDWLWPDLTAAQRKVFVKSLDWRMESFVNHFAWKEDQMVDRKPVQDRPPIVYERGSLSGETGSHPFEGFWDTFPAALATYGEAPQAKQTFDLGVNWVVGVSSGHGFDEGWNEGPGYSLSKFNWLVHAMAYFDDVLPAANIGQNPWWNRIGEWFCRVTPVGMQHAPWGHGSNREAYYRDNRIGAFVALSRLTGNGTFLYNWQQSGGKIAQSRREWVTLAELLNRPAPKNLRPEADPVGLFPLAGWVMAGTKPPSSAEAYKTSVGMIFASRPAGAYSHSFGSENSFHLYGYGQDLSHAAGTSDYEPHAFHTMSHNSILVDGMGQIQREGDQPRQGFIRAFARGDGYVYWAGDATDAYPHTTGRAGGWWGRLDQDVYGRRDCSHLERFIRHVVFLRGKTFVIFDDLAAAKPTKFTWLYHILPADPIQTHQEGGLLDIGYKVGDVPVRVAHLADTAQLEMVDMQGADGFKNPLTGEDYTDNFGRAAKPRNPKLIAGHNLYITNKTPNRQWHFLSVLAPAEPGQPPVEIERLDDFTVRVGKDVVSFDPASAAKFRANFAIDVPALRAQPKLPAWCDEKPRDPRPAPATAPASGPTSSPATTRT